MRPEIRRMVLEDRRILDAFVPGRGMVWDRTWSELFDGYDHETMMEIPLDAWLRFKDDATGSTGIISLSRFIVHGLDTREGA